jgi:hypothetical protein
LIDPTYDALGAYGAVCGIGGMWLSMSVRARRLSAREIVQETVAALDLSIPPCQDS